jgi:glycosyltransferase involved in cell wall biosynthesis
MSGVSIIIPTTCSKHREHCLLRAIDSALDQASIPVEIIVVVNGGKVDHDLFEKIKSNDRLSVLYLTEGNVSKARHFGILKSSHDYFAFLDDDDELLPNTLKQRFDALEADQYVSAVIFNGYIFNGTEDRLAVDDVFYQEVLTSIELSCLTRNIFGSLSAIFNKRNIDTDIFDIEYKYFELTYIFLRMIECRYKITFINELAFRVYEETSMSASKSEEYMLAFPVMLQQALLMKISEEMKRKLKEKYFTALNMLSVYFLNKGDIKKAFLFHMKCLLSGGVRYIFFTRKFLFYKFDHT